jgi:hypothetical protein
MHCGHVRSASASRLLLRIEPDLDVLPKLDLEKNAIGLPNFS